MANQYAFRLRNPLLLMALAAAYPVISYSAGAGSIDFAVGNVTALSAAGAQRPLTKGAEISNGDTVRTGDGGRAQVRFSDGAMVSLQPKTEFRIDNYQYANRSDGSEKGFFSLLKGGMRTITGLIGRSNRDNYKVTTSVATIGIRGTEYTGAIDPDSGQLTVNTGEGLVEVCNAAGCVLLASGESGVVGGAGTTPRRTDAYPQLPPAQPEESLLPTFSASESRNADGKPAAGPASAAPVIPPSTVTIGHIVNGGAVFRNNATATFNADGSLQSYTAGTFASNQGTAQATDVGASDAIVKWGRWANGTATVDNLAVTLSANQGFHYVLGVPTAVMPTAGTASYTLLGGTSPTETSGTWTPGTLTNASLSVNFGALTVASTLGVSINSQVFNMTGSGALSGSGFSSSLSGTGSGCFSGCSGSVSGGFFGTSAERAGIAYSITSTFPTRTITGAAALTQ